MIVYIGVDLHKTQFTVHVRAGDKVEELSEIRLYPTTQAELNQLGTHDSSRIRSRKQEQK